MLLPGRILRRCFASVVLPEQVAPLEEKKMVGPCVPGGYGECAPYADDDNPLLGHRSVQILSVEDGGTESAGNGPDEPCRGYSESAGLVLVRAITATGSRAHPLENLRRQRGSFIGWRTRIEMNPRGRS
jgi:hypothetical protein